MLAWFNQPCFSLLAQLFLYLVDPFYVRYFGLCEFVRPLCLESQGQGLGHRLAWSSPLPSSLSVTFRVYSQAKFSMLVFPSPGVAGVAGVAVMFSTFLCI